MKDHTYIPRRLPGPNGAYLIPLAEVERVLAERAA